MKEIKLTEVHEVFEAINNYPKIISFLLKMAENPIDENNLKYNIILSNNIVLSIDSDLISKFFVAYNEKKIAELN